MRCELLQFIIWILKPAYGLLSFIEFIAFITHTGDLVDFDTNSPFYWILSVIIGLYAVTLPVHALWIASTENYRDRFFPWAFGYPPIRIAALLAVYFKLRSTDANMFLFWYDLACVAVVFLLTFIVAIRAYYQQPKSKPLIGLQV